MKSRKVLFALVLALVLCMSASAAMAAVTSLSEFKDALTGITADKTIDIGASFTIDSPITIDANGNHVTINLSGNTLSFSGSFSASNAITLKNGTFNINGGTLNVSDVSITGNKHVINLNAKSSLTLDSMVINGDDFSAYSVLYMSGGAYNSLTLNKTNIVLSNVAGGGSVINGDSSNGEPAPITLTDSKISVTNGVRGIVVYGGDRVFTATNSEITLTNLKDNALNILGQASLNNTKVTINGSKARGITMRDNKSTLSLSNGSVINISNCDEGDIMFKNDTIRDGIIKIDLTSNMYFDTVTHNKASAVLQPADYINAYKLPADAVITQLSDGTYYVGVPVVASVPSYSAPRTGDNSNIALWIALMAISAISFMALGKKSRFN